MATLTRKKPGSKKKKKRVEKSIVVDEIPIIEPATPILAVAEPAPIVDELHTVEKSIAPSVEVIALPIAATQPSTVAAPVVIVEPPATEAPPITHSFDGLKQLMSTEDSGVIPAAYPSLEVEVAIAGIEVEVTEGPLYPMLGIAAVAHDIAGTTVIAVAPDMVLEDMSGRMKYSTFVTTGTRKTHVLALFADI